MHAWCRHCAAPVRGSNDSSSSTEHESTTAAEALIASLQDTSFDVRVGSVVVAAADRG
jgi:hypothetical protein